MNFKKIVAGSIIAGFGVTGAFASVAYANDGESESVTDSVNAVESEGGWFDRVVGLPGDAKFDDVEFPGDILLNEGTQTHSFWIISHYNDVPILKYAAIGEDRIEGVDKVVEQLEFKDDQGDIKEQIEGTEISGAALPHFLHEPPKEIMAEWKDAMKKKGLELVSDGDNLDSYLENVKKSLGDDFKDATDNKRSSNSTFLFLDKENLYGEGSFKMMSLNKDEVRNFSTVKANGENNGDGMSEAPTFLIADVEGINAITAGNVDSLDDDSEPEGK